MAEPNNPYADTQLVGGHTLTVYSSPELGATVELDGRVRGRMPTIMQGVSSGPHVLKLRLEGYEELTHTFNLQSNAHLNLSLEPLRPTQVLVWRSRRQLALLAAGAAAFALVLVAAVGAALLIRSGATGADLAPLASPVARTTPAAQPTQPPRPTSTLPAVGTVALPTPEPTATERPKILASVSLARSLDRSGAPVDATTTFGPEDTIFVSAEAGGLPAGTPVRITIVADRVPGAPPNFEFARSDLASPAGGRIAIGLLGPSDGWPIGRYRANIYVREVLDYSLEFQVR